MATGKACRGWATRSLVLPVALLPSARNSARGAQGFTSFQHLAACILGPFLKRMSPSLRQTPRRDFGVRDGGDIDQNQMISN